MKKELVFSNIDNRNIFAFRQSYRTLVIPKTRKIVDSDKTILTDKRGFRYYRNFGLEYIERKDCTGRITFEPIGSSFVFTMI